MRKSLPFTGTIRDKDVQILAGLSVGLRSEYTDSGRIDWVRSPFAWIKTRPSRQVGKIGEQLISGWCAARDLNVERSPDSEADRVIEGQRVEIKFSTLWDIGVYTFQQIRNQNYQFLVCIGISPFDAKAWIFKKSEIPFRRLSHQHGGKAGRDTWWLSFKPESPPDWVRKQPGKLSYVHRVLAGLR